MKKFKIVILSIIKIFSVLIAIIGNIMVLVAFGFAMYIITISTHSWIVEVSGSNCRFIMLALCVSTAVMLIGVASLIKSHEALCKLKKLA